jgi:hypothetical protein
MREYNQEERGANLDAFLSDLTEVSRRHGIAIDGDPQLFVMDSEDFWFGYAADEADRLVRR